MHTALICVLVAGLMPYLWTGVAKFTGPRYDNADVRGWQSRLAGLPYRANAAHLNSFEAFPLFGLAVLAAFLTGADAQRVMLLSVAFIGLRLLYGIVYLMDIASVRSLVWLGAFGCTIAIFLAAIAAVAGR